ncbi:MAG TPA: glycosyltransferase family 4 protein [Victivallales bacterium]|nr:glycosyltransferase family 4 protein [Victivallales bacterium]
MNVAILCSGCDSVKRGFETHSRNLFEHLKSENNDDDYIFFKGDGETKEDEKIIFRPSRGSFLCIFLSKFRGTNWYWESIFFALGFLLQNLFYRRKFERILCIEATVSNVLFKFKFLFPKAKIIWTHGNFIDPEKYPAADLTHEVNIENYIKAKKKLPERNLVLVPHFYSNKNVNSSQNKPVSKKFIKKKYNIKTSKVLLSVGVIENTQKRMGYIIDEFEKLSDDWSLVFCGRIGDIKIIEKAKNKYGERFIQVFLPHNLMNEIYSVSDLFVLASLNEGFGLVILEAMSNGCPIVLNNRKLFHWILKTDRDCINMEHSGNLANFILEKEKIKGWFKKTGIKNKEIFQSNYTWNVLEEKYLSMIHTPTNDKNII